MFTYSIENYGVCGYNAIPSEGKKRQYDTHDFCSILRRYQGRTDFVLDQYLAAMFKLDQDVRKSRMTNIKINSESNFDLTFNSSRLSLGGKKEWPILICTETTNRSLFRQ